MREFVCVRGISVLCTMSYVGRKIYYVDKTRHTGMEEGI